MRNEKNRERNDDDSREPPELFSIHRAKVSNIKEFGAFAKLSGFKQDGLIHITQLADQRVENINDVIELNEEVFVKVIAFANGKMSLSLKLVDQTSGEDKDPNNIILNKMERSKKQVDYTPQKPIGMEAILDTVCTRCNGHGHLSTECFVDISKGTNNYNLIEADEEEKKFEAKNPALANLRSIKVGEVKDVKQAMKIIHEFKKRQKKSKKEKKNKKRKHR